jgi:hypothetical protein
VKCEISWAVLSVGGGYRLEFFEAVEVNHAIVITQFQSVGFSSGFQGVVIAPLVVEDFKVRCTARSHHP